MTDAGLPRVPLKLSPKGEIQQVGEYRVLSRIGKGGMGVVYEVQRGESSTLLALKTIETRLLVAGEAAARSRFDQEIRVLQKLEHPNVIRIEDAGIADHPHGYEVTFMLTERLFGRPLSDLMTPGQRWSMSDALPKIRDLAAALVYLDAQGVQHRDIKPGNIFCDQSGRTVLIDFGLARREDMTRLTSAGHVIGSRSYMAPERFLSEPTSILTDVFSLGVVMFRMLTGRAPFEGATLTDLMVAIRGGLAADERREISSPTAGRLITEMLTPDPKGRPHPKEVVRRIDSIIIGHSQTEAFEEPLPAVQVPVVTRADPVPSELSTPLEPSAPVARPKAARTVSVMLAAALAGVTLGLGFFAGRWTAPTPDVGLPSTPVEAPSPPPPPPPPPRPRVLRSPPLAPPPAPPVVAPTPAPSFATAEAAYAYGQYASLEGRNADAVRALQRAIVLNPVMAEAHRALGDAYRLGGDRAKAGKAYRTYLALRPGAPDAAEVRAHLK